MTSPTRKARKAGGRKPHAAAAPGAAASLPSGRGSDTRDRILAAARDLFSEYGFFQVSSDRVCRRAQVSKSSLYKYFGDMAGLFIAVVKNEGDLFDLGFDRCPDTEEAFRTAMTDYGARLLRLLNDPFCIKLDRLLHEEARRHQTLAMAYYDSTYGRCHEDMAELISHGQARGFVRRTEPAADLADYLVSAWEGLSYTRARLGLIEKPFDAPAARSRQCVNLLFPQRL